MASPIVPCQIQPEFSLPQFLVVSPFPLTSVKVILYWNAPPVDCVHNEQLESVGEEEEKIKRRRL